MNGFRVLTASVALGVTLCLAVPKAAQNPPPESADIQLHIAQTLFGQGRYLDALDAYQNAVRIAAPDQLRAARSGLVVSALRVGDFTLARQQAQQMVQESPRSPDALALYGDALWSSGRFDEAERSYRKALGIAPELARGLHGLARALAARSRLADALSAAEHALRLAPRDLEIHHTVATIYEREHNYEKAAAEFANYVDLLPNKDTSPTALWSRAEIRFLRSFGQRVPFAADPGSDAKLYTVPFRVVNDKIVIRARVNGAVAQDFVVDTGSENTVVTRTTAARLGILPITQTLSAGVGEVGLRGLQLGRIDTLEIGDLRLRNVPCLIKNPPLRDPELPIRETEGLSPLALGYSMIVDYKTQLITIGKHLPDEPEDFELPLRLNRLATVEGTVDGTQPVDFIVDTGGEVVSISEATAAATGRLNGLTRRIALRVYGTSGWDRDAFLLPGVNLAFSNEIRYNNFAVVVLNLDTPSALLGYEVGGIVGHNFLKNYKVSIDLDRSMLGLKRF
jgi:Flp pilus assembly protein TadD/predicted aspartyl protease